MKEQIIKLREEGKSYNEICRELGCSKGTVSYHCGKGQKEKSKKRSQKRREIHVLENKVWRFQKRAPKPQREQVISIARRLLQTKSDDFQRERIGSRGLGRHLEKTFNYKNVLKEHGKNTECYLTGRPINMDEPRTYTFDHVVPVSKGGSNDIDNLGIACKEANAAKHDMTVNELLGFCKEILEHHGYKIRKANPIGDGARLESE